jgi:hypothetical protein
MEEKYNGVIGIVLNHFNMDLSTGNLLIIAFYFFIIFVIGFWVKRNETIREYLNSLIFFSVVLKQLLKLMYYNFL